MEQLLHDNGYNHDYSLITLYLIISASINSIGFESTDFNFEYVMYNHGYYDKEDFNYVNEINRRCHQSWRL